MAGHQSSPFCGGIWLGLQLYPRLMHVLPVPAASVQGAPKEVVNPSTGRASLLESIRQAGGIGKANLRSVKERKLEKKKQKEQEQGAETLIQISSSFLSALGWGGVGLEGDWHPGAQGLYRAERCSLLKGWHKVSARLRLTFLLIWLLGFCSVSVRATGQGGDLMSDLFNKLVLRRKGTVAQGGLLHPSRKEVELFQAPQLSATALEPGEDSFLGLCVTAWLGVHLQGDVWGTSPSHDQLEIAGDRVPKADNGL